MFEDPSRGSKATTYRPLSAAATSMHFSFSSDTITPTCGRRRWVEEGGGAGIGGGEGEGGEGDGMRREEEWGGMKGMGRRRQVEEGGDS